MGVGSHHPNTGKGAQHPGRGLVQHLTEDLFGSFHFGLNRR